MWVTSATRDRKYLAPTHTLYHTCLQTNEMRARVSIVITRGVFVPGFTNNPVPPTPLAPVPNCCERTKCAPPTRMRFRFPNVPPSLPPSPCLNTGFLCVAAHLRGCSILVAFRDRAARFSQSGLARQKKRTTRRPASPRCSDSRLPPPCFYFFISGTFSPSPGPCLLGLFNRELPTEVKLISLVKLPPPWLGTRFYLP